MSNQNNSKGRFDNRIEELLHNIAQESAMVNYKIESEDTSTQHNGYLGLITAICITGKTTYGEDKTLHLILKAASKNENLRNQTPLINEYEQEIYIYSIVIPAFRKFEMNRNVPPFYSSAKFYKACLIEKNEALILDNLRETGYSMWDKTIPMEHDHVSFVMKEYGRFHAVSFAMRDQEPEKFRKLTSSLHDVLDLVIGIEGYIKLFKDQCKKATKCLDVTADGRAYTTFTQFINGELEEFLKSGLKCNDAYSVILHGDCWINNMMFKYEDKNHPKRPTKMCLLDFQLSRLGSPVLDLAYFLYASSSKKVLDDYEYYLNMYHTSLSSHLRKLGSDPKKMYPFSVFKEQWKTYSKFGLIYSMIILYMMFTQQHEVIDFADALNSGKGVDEFFNYDIANAELYNDRVKHVILHFVNNDYI